METEDLEWKYLEGDGDFRSEEVKRLRDEADIIVTNPPFSLFREFLAWIREGEDSHAENAEVAEKKGNEKGLGVSGQEFENENEVRKFLIIGNMNAITYKEVFPLIKDNRLWLGESIHSGDREFGVPKEYPLNAAGWRIDEQGNHYIRVKGVRWFTNLEHGRRHQPLQLMTMADNIKFSRHKDLRGKEYLKYDNYDAIEVPFTDAIPSDYDGVIFTDLTVADICDGFVYNELEGKGLFGWGGKLVIQPEYSNLKKLKPFTPSRRRKRKRRVFLIALCALSATRRAQSEFGSSAKWTPIM